jgi:hypothetical protein
MPLCWLATFAGIDRRATKLPLLSDSGAAAGGAFGIARRTICSSAWFGSVCSTSLSSAIGDRPAVSLGTALALLICLTIMSASPSPFCDICWAICWSYIEV